MAPRHPSRSIAAALLITLGVAGPAAAQTLPPDSALWDPQWLGHMLNGVQRSVTPCLNGRLPGPACVKRHYDALTTEEQRQMRSGFWQGYKFYGGLNGGQGGGGEYPRALLGRPYFRSPGAPGTE